MRLKSYFAGTVESAMRLAREELGEEAMLLNSRKAPPEARHLGAYEVVFAAAEVSPSAATARPVPPHAGSTGNTQALAGEVADIRRQLARMSAVASRSGGRLEAGRLSPYGNPALEQLEGLLALAGVDLDLSLEILRSLQGPGTMATGRQVREAFELEVKKRVRVSTEFPRIVALVGPPGAGKTTMLVKLAVHYGLITRRPTQILSIDPHRVAASEQLRSYAAILGMGFETMETVGALAQSLEEHAGKELILLDTPGYGPKEMDLAPDLAQFLSTYPSLDVHLVLSCCSKPADLSSVVDRYAIFHPSKLLFTRLDETSSYGCILNETARTELPLSFFGTGQRIPDDFEPAELDRVLELLCGGRESRAAHAV